MKRLKTAGAAMLMGALLAGCAGMMTGGTELIARPIAEFDQVGRANWRMEDGVLVADRKESKTPAYLVTRESYGDVSLRAEFWASEDANTGIFMRCADPKQIAAKTCYEVNVFDKRADPSYGTGAIVDVAKVSPMPKAGGKWNVFEVKMQGDRLEVTLNGEKTVDVRDAKFKSGPIALQFDTGLVKFRSVKVKAL